MTARECVAYGHEGAGRTGDSSDHVRIRRYDLDDRADSDLLAATVGVLSGDLLVRRGFLPDDRLPLSRYPDHRSTFAVRPLGDLDEAAWNVNSSRLTDPSNWLLSVSERDTT